MEIHNRRNLYYNNYSPTLLHTNNFYNKRKYLEKTPPDNLSRVSPSNNLTRITPSYSGNPQVNRINIYPPNFPSTINKNSSYNIYELNIPKKILMIINQLIILLTMQYLHHHYI